MGLVSRGLRPYRRVMTRPAMRLVLGLVVTAGFCLLWASIAFQWPAMRWIAVAGYALLFVGVIVGLLRRRRRVPESTTSHPTASDAYSDVVLGRTPPTFPEPGRPTASLVEDPPGTPGSVLRTSLDDRVKE